MCMHGAFLHISSACCSCCCYKPGSILAIKVLLRLLLLAVSAAALHRYTMRLQAPCKCSTAAALHAVGSSTSSDGLLNIMLSCGGCQAVEAAKNVAVRAYMREACHRSLPIVIEGEHILVWCIKVAQQLPS